MGKIGVIANPTSGKDIRRLVGQALVVGNTEKINIVKRILIGAYAVGVRDFLLMPDSFHIAENCIHGLKNLYPDLVKVVRILEMDVNDSGLDSIIAARMMHDEGVDCIITLGGDGTVRVVSKGAGSTPILPISTGTNNVIPQFIEGTIAGMAAGYFSLMSPDQMQATTDRQKQLDILVNGELVDTSLVDMVITRDQHIGSKAVWDPDQLLQVAVTRAAPTNIGFSSIIGNYQMVKESEPIGAAIKIKKEGRCYRIQVPIGPGMISEICVDEFIELKPGVTYAVVEERPAAIALDGEREIVLKDGDSAEFRLNLDGPFFVNYEKVMESNLLNRSF